MAYQAWVTNAQTVLQQRQEQEQEQELEQAGQLPTGELAMGVWRGCGVLVLRFVVPTGRPSQEEEPELAQVAGMWVYLGWHLDEGWGLLGLE